MNLVRKWTATVFVVAIKNVWSRQNSVGTVEQDVVGCDNPGSMLTSLMSCHIVSDKHGMTSTVIDSKTSQIDRSQTMPAAVKYSIVAVACRSSELLCGDRIGYHKLFIIKLKNFLTLKANYQKSALPC